MGFRWRGHAVVAVLALAAAVLVPAAGVDAAPKDQPGKTYVGPIDGTDAYVGLIIGKNGAFGYICDSKGITQWLHGAIKGRDVALTSATGAAVVAKLANGELTGTAFLPASPSTDASVGDQLATSTAHAFSAERAKGKAGLYRLEKKVDGATFAAGWVRLNDGTFRGQITVAQPAAGAAPTTVSPTNPGVGQASVGTVQAGQIAPEAIQALFPGTPRRLQAGTPVASRTCATATSRFSAAVTAWTAAGAPFSGPLYDAAKAAADEMVKACGGIPVGP